MHILNTNRNSGMGRENRLSISIVRQVEMMLQIFNK